MAELQLPGGYVPGRLRPERLWLLLSVIWLIAFTLAPFELSVVPEDLPYGIEESLQVGDSLSPLKFVGHFASFFVIGVIAGANCSERRRARFSSLLVAAAFGCVLLEGMQLFQLGRHARLTDLVLNMIGFAAGLAVAHRTAAGRRLIDRLRSAHAGAPMAQVAALAVALAAWWIIGLRPAFGALRMNWDRTFPVTIGNEIGGARVWAGQVRYTGIYDRALSSNEVGRLFGGLERPGIAELRLQEGLLTGYDLLKSTSAGFQSQGELKGEHLDLVVPRSLAWSATDGLTTAPGPVVKTRGPATELIDRIAASGEFAVEAWVRPDNIVQAGPARVVSNSSGVGARNFTLGQSGTDLVLRVRNGVNSPNGNIYELIARNVVATDWQHFVAAYDHGVSAAYKNGILRATIDLREPIFHCGLGVGPMAKGALLVLAAMTISLPAAFVFEFIFHSIAAWFATFVFALIAGISPYLLSCFIVGGPFRIDFIGWFLFTLLLVFPSGLIFILKRGRQRSENSPLAQTQTNAFTESEFKIEC